jgi:hypothetical protein
VTACAQPRGIVIEVDPGATSADSVQLFIGRTPCEGVDCGGIQPPDVRGKLPGEVFYRDGDPVYQAAVDNGVARFQLVPAGSAEQIPLVIAVGFHDAASPAKPVGVASLSDVVVADDAPAIFRLALVGATAHALGVPTEMPVPDGDRVQVWSDSNTGCVVVQHWHGGTSDQAFVVPIEDPDCDDITDKECDPDAYHASSAPTQLDQTTCVASFAESGRTECRLGGAGCVDGIGQEACAPSPFCIPDAACTCADAQPSCFLDRFTNNAPTRIECNVPTLGGSPCQGNLTATVNLDMLFSMHHASCAGMPVEFYSFKTGGGSLAFGPKLALDNNLAFTASPPVDPCSFELTWTNPNPSPVIGDDRGIVELDLGNGEDALLPIVIHWMPDACGMPMSCTVDLGNSAAGIDGMWGCLDD